MKTPTEKIKHIEREIKEFKEEINKTKDDLFLLKKFNKDIQKKFYKIRLKYQRRF